MNNKKLIGKTIENIRFSGRDVVFEISNTEKINLFDIEPGGSCAASIEIIEGDLNNLIGKPITKSNIVEDTSRSNPDDLIVYYVCILKTKYGTVKIKCLVESDGHSNLD